MRFRFGSEKSGRDVDLGRGAAVGVDGGIDDPKISGIMVAFGGGGGGYRESVGSLRRDPGRFHRSHSAPSSSSDLAGAATGVKKGFHEVATLELDAVDAGLLL